MILADWIAVGIVAAAIVLGLAAGFSGGLRFFTSGVFGVIISLVVCYFISGIVMQWTFVTDLMAKITGWISVGSDSLKLQIATIVLYVLMFIVVQICRIIVVKILTGIAEINNG
ncbi:MAG: hypothetical protein ACI4L9_01650, partial [Candidatus Coproplasma sp.]